MATEHQSPEQEKLKSFKIIVNARPREVTGEKISYEAVVKLAFPDADVNQFLYKVQYIGHHVPDGTLADGQSVKLENGLKFDVTKTNRS